MTLNESLSYFRLLVHPLPVDLQDSAPVGQLVTDEANSRTSCSLMACRFKRARVATPSEQQLGDHEISSVSTSHRQAPPSRIIRISPDE